MTKIKCPSCDHVFIKEKQEPEWADDSLIIHCPNCDDYMDAKGIDYWKEREQ